MYSSCDTAYSVDYNELNADERKIHDETVIAMTVDTQLPTLAEVSRPSRRWPSIDFLWLTGLVVYWTVGMLVLWGVLTVAAVPGASGLALLVGTAVFSFFAAQWWKHHAEKWSALKEHWKRFEQWPRDHAARESDRERLREQLRSALSP